MARAEILVVLLALSGTEAWAHEVGLSRGEYRLEGNTVAARLIFARSEVAVLVDDADGTVVEAELDRARGILASKVIGKIAVRGDGESCPGTIGAVSLTEEDGLLAEARFTCEDEPKVLEFELGFFEELSHGHRHLAHAEAGGVSVDPVLFRQSRAFSIQAGEGGSETGFGSILLLGIEHIALGFDHLVFLLGLIIVGGRLRSIVVVITAFTIAHSITLGLATVGVWSPSPRVIEPLIALSIVYVGIENYFVKSAEGRWRITFPFGLVHGFGFAGALAEIGLPEDRIAGALLAFNLGVEIGQLAIILAVMPLILAARKRAWFTGPGVKSLNALIVLLGAIWLVDRLS